MRVHQGAGDEAARHGDQAGHQNRAGNLVCFLAQGSGAIKAPEDPTKPFLSRPEIAAALQRMEHRIKCARTERVTVPGKLVNHPLAIEFVSRGMVQNMKPNQAFQQLLVLHSRHCRLKTSLSHTINH